MPREGNLFIQMYSHTLIIETYSNYIFRVSSQQPTYFRAWRVEDCTFDYALIIRFFLSVLVVSISLTLQWCKETVRIKIENNENEFSSAVDFPRILWYYDRQEIFLKFANRHGNVKICVAIFKQYHLTIHYFSMSESEDWRQAGKARGNFFIDVFLEISFESKTLKQMQRIHVRGTIVCVSIWRTFFLLIPIFVFSFHIICQHFT